MGTVRDSIPHKKGPAMEKALDRVLVFKRRTKNRRYFEHYFVYYRDMQVGCIIGFGKPKCIIRK